MFNFKEFSKRIFISWPNTALFTTKYLEEGKKPESKAATAGVAADDKGKMHELLLSKYLHPEQRLPEHHRSESENDEYAGTPIQVHDRLMKKMGEDAYKEIDSHAKATASELKRYLKDNGYIDKDVDIGNVHWTSNRDTEKSKGDHEKTTGVKDINSNADIILTLKNKKTGKIVGYHGVSAKYGSEKEPNYKNPGMDTLEKMSGLESGTISKMLEPHKQAMAKLGYDGTIDERHAKYKVDSMGINKAAAEKKRLDTLVGSGRKLSLKERILHSHLSSFIDSFNSKKSPEDKQAFLQQAKDRATTAENSARTARAGIAKAISQSLDQKSRHSKGGSDSYLRELIRSHVSPKTIIPHTIAHSWVQTNGSAKPLVKSSEDVANNHLDNFEGLHVAMDKAGGSITIKGYHKDTKKLTNVATYGLKSQSGPHKGLNATLKLQ
ncbi:MAG: hypothetical protein EBU90_19520 [Proteobacteria bacterium]|nr:hypothetical protein [Pseudomonadota bacterium]NBP15704.1 hypothetical protein [bacterium]